MPSKRNASTKSVVGENVLCYEPHKNKRLELYDSKIMKIKPDDEDCDNLVFYVHFNGWRKTYDCWVTDEFLLKINNKNLQLQKKLAKEAKLTPVRRNRRKRKAESVDNDIEPVPNVTNELPKRNLPALNFPCNLMDQVKADRDLVRDKNCLVRIPVEPNVITLMESFLKHSVLNSFRDEQKNNCRPEFVDEHELKNRFNQCVRVLNFIRMCFNKYIRREILINENEIIQFDDEATKMKLEPVNNILQNLERENGKEENVHSPTGEYAESQKICSGRRLTRSQYSFELLQKDMVSRSDIWKAILYRAYNEEIT